MCEIVGTFLTAKMWDERADCSGEPWNISRGALAQECLEFAVGHLDRIEVGRIFRQITKRRSGFLDRLANARSKMDSAVIHHHNIVALERWHQAALHIGEEHLSIHGAF